MVYDLMPKLPTDKSEIRGSHLPKKDQVWYRDETYLQWDWNVNPRDEDGNKLKLWYEVADEDQKKWYFEEVYRINNGCWVMIEGVPTWFNKGAYFFHQWFVLLIEQIYPSYKDTSLEYFRFVELCEEDPGTLGDCGIKGRRVGLSSMASSLHLQTGIIENDTLQGIVSKTGTDAFEMYLMIRNGLENLPGFLIPELNKVTDSELKIAKQTKKISANNKTVDSDKGLNNRINWLDTAENAYDGRNTRRVIVDEAAKWEKVNVRKCIDKISETLVVGSDIMGYLSVFSSVNAGDKGGDNFRAIWDGSDHINGKKDAFGRTETKLKRFFIAGYRGLKGYIDKYGNSVVDTPTKEQSEFMAAQRNPKTGKLICLAPHIGAREYLEEARKMKAHDPELYAEQVRMYPFEWEEVFKGANNRCHFDLEELNEQISEIEAELKEKGISENGVRGKWKEKPNGDAYFVQDPKGICFMLKFLPEDKANKVTLVDSTTCPENTAFGAAGLDPYSNSQPTAEQGSDACLLVFERYNVLDPENSGMPVGMILGRLPTKEAFYTQCRLMLRYFGIKMLAERSPTDWEDYFIGKRLADPLSVKKKRKGFLVTTIRGMDKAEIYGAAAQDPNGREAHLTAMIEYALNNMKKIRFIRLLKDMLYFNIKDRMKYDACMAFGYALIAASVNVEPPKSKPREEQMIKTFRLAA